MTEQLSFLIATTAASTGLPPPAQEILHAARSIGFTVRIVRGDWGIGMQLRGRKWILTGSCCCPLAAWLVVKGIEGEKGDGSPTRSIARHLGIDDEDVYRFMAGFDGEKDDGSAWFGYGRRVAKELGL